MEDLWLARDSVSLSSARLWSCLESWRIIHGLVRLKVGEDKGLDWMGVGIMEFLTGQSSLRLGLGMVP
jgi:hypothetical protein